MKSFFDNFSSPIGRLLIIYLQEEDGPVVLRVKVGNGPLPSDARRAMLPGWLREAFLDYLEGNARTVNVPYRIEGPLFYRKVWLKTLDIPYGQTRTYRWMAEAVGSPRGSRAVGQALRRNPLPIILPCHRVVGSDGSLRGYSAGLSVKKALLEIEKKALTGP